MIFETVDLPVTHPQNRPEPAGPPSAELVLLQRTSRVLNSTRDLDQVLSAILQEVHQLLGITAGSIWLIDPETDELVCRQAAGPCSELVKDQRLASGKGIASWVVRTGQSLIVPDTQLDPRHCKKIDRRTGLEMRSLLSFPLGAQGKILGALQILDTEVDRFGPRDLTLLQTLAPWIAIAIENARLVETLHTRNQELDAFARTVAHDLKNPLALVLGFAEVLAEDLPELSAQEIQASVDRIVRNGHKMHQIIESLLLLTQVRRLEKVDIQPLNIDYIMSQVQERLNGLVQERQAEITLPSKWPLVLGYEPWIEEVWVNYLSNAIKYGGQPPRIEVGFELNGPWQGRLDGAITAALRKFHLDADLPLRQVCFYVQDNGPGLTPGEQDRLFQPFIKLDPHSEGHGLGLSIVHHIVEKLGGYVGVESQENRGSKFTFTLPGLFGHTTADPTASPANPLTD